MEQKNLLLAIILSALIMVGFQWYASHQRTSEAEKVGDQSKNDGLTSLPQQSGSHSEQARKKSIVELNAPSLPLPIPGGNNLDKEAKKLENAISRTPRIKIKSPRVTGSISLIGARIDNLTLKNYRETIEPDSKYISLLLPFGSATPY